MLRWIDAEHFPRALDILYARDVRYVSFFGGEPLLHPRLPDMIRVAVDNGMGTAIVTNGWLLAQLLDRLAAAGLKTVYVSIDAAVIADHEENRGLKGACDRIRTATQRMPELGITAIAQVTISKLIRDRNSPISNPRTRPGRRPQPRSLRVGKRHGGRPEIAQHRYQRAITGSRT